VWSDCPEKFQRVPPTPPHERSRFRSDDDYVTYATPKPDSHLPGPFELRDSVQEKRDCIFRDSEKVLGDLGPDHILVMRNLTHRGVVDLMDETRYPSVYVLLACEPFEIVLERICGGQLQIVRTNWAGKYSTT